MRVDHNIQPTSVSNLDPPARPGDCAIVRFLTDDMAAQFEMRNTWCPGRTGRFPGEADVALSTYDVHPANVDDPRFWQFWDFVPRKSPDDRLVGKFVDRRLCDGPLDRRHLLPKML